MLHSRAFGISFVSAVVVAALIVALGLVVSRSQTTSADDPVQVFDGSGAVSNFKSLDEARAYVGSKAGFEVPAPTSLPTGFRVTELVFSPRQPDPRPNLDRVTYKIRRGSTGFTLLFVGRPFSFPDKDDAHIVSRPNNQSAIYKSTDRDVTEYTLLTDTNGWVVTVSDSLGITWAEIQIMLSSFVAK